MCFYVKTELKIVNQITDEKEKITKTKLLINLHSRSTYSLSPAEEDSVMWSKAPEQAS